MKLSFSNIGWDIHDDPAVLDALRASGVHGIEVAPTKVWPNWEGANAENARAYRVFLEQRGFRVPALQAILFGRPELKLFDDTAAGREALVAHMETVADVAQALGASVLVFGAPKARLRGSLSPAEAMERACEVFRRLGAVCAARDTRLCIEPNPSEYGCDFVTNAREALTLVEEVNHPGFALHLDAAALYMADDPFETLLPRALPSLCHYHISEPYLSGFVEPKVPHAAWLQQLSASNYEGWFSVEVDAKKHTLADSLVFLRSIIPSV